jgi:hypothetical protein
MGKQTLTYIGVLIGIYLVVKNGNNTGIALKAGASGATSVIDALQGR